METFVEVMERVEGVELDRLEPMTTLHVWTWNSIYRVVVSEGSEVLVQGGSLFPAPTPAHIDGASTGHRLVRTGWIGLGLLMQFHVGQKRVVTSPVIAIATEPPRMSVVH